MAADALAPYVVRTSAVMIYQLKQWVGTEQAVLF